jgi:hypothetical protein
MIIFIFNFLLFIETPSITHILPVVCPSNFLLTSRGRVVYGLLTIDSCNEYTNEYLSDEYRPMITGKKNSTTTTRRSEADIEKVRKLFFNFN